MPEETGINRIGQKRSAGIALATLSILIFGEIIPKNIAKLHGEKLFRSTLWLTNITFYALSIPVTLLNKLSDFLIYRLSGDYK